MLIPHTRVVFEGLSRDYYARAKELASAKLNACVRLVFADFEGAVFYGEGKPVTALQESGLWMALGEEVIAPLENKATVTDGSMAVYELSPEMLAFFSGRRIESTVDVVAEPPVSPQVLLDNLVRDRATCIFKVRGPVWLGYAFIGGGRIISASFASERETVYGESAAGAIRRAAGRAAAAMYFLEGGAPFAEVTPPAPAEKPAATGIGSAGPEEAAPAPGPEATETPISPPAPTAVVPVSREIQLRVVTSREEGIRLLHKSKQDALEMLEERSVAWVDSTVFRVLDEKETNWASLSLPGGKSQQVMLLKMDLLSDPGMFIVLPRKLRRRLSVTPGTTVTLKAISTVVPGR